MKKALGSIQYRLVFLFFALMNTVYALAQDGSSGGSVSVSKTTSSTNNSAVPDASWYTNPWVWVVGGAVFILLLIALLRGSNSTVVDRTGTGTTTVHKTTVTRTDESGLDA